MFPTLIYPSLIDYDLPKKEKIVNNNYNDSLEQHFFK